MRGTFEKRPAQSRLCRFWTMKAWQHSTESNTARGYGAQWRKLRTLVMQRDAGICQPCKKMGILHMGTEVDHIKPKAQGGTDDMGNLQTICSEAHKRKTTEENGKTWRAPTGADGWPL
jgi:5-methylcytosine-specific restriction protein A